MREHGRAVARQVIAVLDDGRLAAIALLTRAACPVRASFLLETLYRYAGRFGSSRASLYYYAGPLACARSNPACEVLTNLITDFDDPPFAFTPFSLRRSGRHRISLLHNEQITFGVQIHVHVPLSQSDERIACEQNNRLPKCNTEPYCALAIYHQRVRTAEARADQRLF